MAIQLFVLVGVAAWIGQKLDKALQTSKPYITILLILLFTAAFFYKLVKDLGQRNES
jgi:di/tricarboxylate transporter